MSLYSTCQKKHASGIKQKFNITLEYIDPCWSGLICYVEEKPERWLVYERDGFVKDRAYSRKSCHLNETREKLKDFERCLEMALKEAIELATTCGQTLDLLKLLAEQKWGWNGDYIKRALKKNEKPIEFRWLVGISGKCSKARLFVTG